MCSLSSVKRMELKFLRPTHNEINYFLDHYHPRNVSVGEEQASGYLPYDSSNIRLEMSLSDFTQMVRDTICQNVNVEEIKDLNNLCAIRYKEDAVNPEQLHMLLSKLRDANPSIMLFALPDQYYLEGMDVQQLKNIRSYIDELIASSNFDTFAGMGIQT